MIGSVVSSSREEGADGNVGMVVFPVKGRGVQGKLGSRRCCQLQILVRVWSND